MEFADWFNDPDALAAWCLLVLALLTMCATSAARGRQWAALTRVDGDAGSQA